MHWPSRNPGGGGSGGGSAAPASTASVSKSSKAPKSSEDDIMSGSFDPTNLEKGAAALKEIDSSKNAGLAFQMATFEEKTVQLGIERDMEKQKTQRMQMEEQLIQLQQDEFRKTVSHIADQERVTAQHKAQVESQLQGHKLEVQKENLNYQLKREQEQFMQHEAIRVKNEKMLEEAARETLRAKGSHDIETAKSTAKAEMAGRAQQERENIEIRLRELRAKSAEQRRTSLESIDEIFSSATAGMQALYDDRTKAATLVGGLTLLALGVYSARAATRVAGSVLERHLGRPPLVRETSRWTWRPSLSLLPWNRKSQSSLFDNIVLEEELAGRLKWTTNALLSAQENGTPFRHLLLHGPPGTGKTLFARTLARQSGLDYAVMSGGDLGPLGREGPHELHKLFDWAKNSKRGLVLFVDEADAFLRTGRSADASMSEDARNALSVFLHHTGTESARIAVILATNIPSALDRAVLDRMDESFEFPKPAYDQRVAMLNLFVERYLHAAGKNNRAVIQVDPEINEKFLAEVAKRTEGLSGRQLAKLVLAFQSAVFGSGSQKLTLGLAETVLQWRLTNPNA
eukprot:TRINITY_DN24349_c0_g1_i2.p1 TRINITY_DN24349_c0_g1~~TRINITY_DN24349_c0_g1_i2.p1  ORF type:complete len:572 (-),score=125.10 TRINITY_DN24349_c0_g1_i2:169-1884(-)